MVKWKLACVCDVCGLTERNFASKKNFFEHVKFYFQQTGKSLGFYTDQVIEAMHQYVDKRLTRSNYIVKDITSDIHGEKLLKGIHHINSYNLSNWFNKILCIYRATAHAQKGIGGRS